MEISILRLLDTYASKIAKELQLLGVQACNSANRAAFQNGLLAELKARMS